MADDRAEVEARVSDCYAGWSRSYHHDYYGAGAPHPPVHLDLLVRLLHEAGARSVLDAGCGPASFLRHLDASAMELSGFDLTPAMVAEARRVMEGRARIWQGSVGDPAAFRPPGGPARPVDAAVCVGVLPHVPAHLDAPVLANLRGAVRPGGLVVASARNMLFGLFTLNRHSHALFADELVRWDDLAAAAGPDERAGLERAAARLRERFRMDLPPVRGGEGGAPGYDEVLSRMHNPLVLRAQAEAAGLTGVRVLFFHYHRLPPMLEEEVPELARRAALEAEDPDDWRGLVMASAFLVAGTAP